MESTTSTSVEKGIIWVQWGEREVLAKIAFAIKFGLRYRPELPIAKSDRGSGPERG